VAKARAIIKRRKAVINIRKITRTMEMIATARFKKAHDRAAAARAYTDKLGELVRDIAEAGGQARHPLLEKHDPVRRGMLLVLSANRGLCGGYNSGVLRTAMGQLQQAGDSDVETDLHVAGKRGINYFRFRKIEAAQTYTQFENRPQYAEIEPIADAFIDDYIAGKIDVVQVAYMKFVSAARQKPVVETLLPADASALAEPSREPAGRANVEYEFQPGASAILSAVVPLSVKARLLKCFLDAAVSEQVARMVAMRGATENAETMIKNLAMAYNRARQTQITSEIAELLGGAAALEE